MNTFYAITLILAATGIASLYFKFREGWIALGLALILMGAFVDSFVSWGFIALGLVTISLVSVEKPE